MIEINLLPRTGKNASRRSGSALAASLAGITAKVRDPYLAGAVGSLLLAAAVIGALHWHHMTRVAEVTALEQQAVQDSTRYAAILKEAHSAMAQRDSIVTQLEIIKSIDNDRFVWPHVMEEVSRALPAYTWLTGLQQTSAVVSAAARPDTTAKRGGGVADSLDAAPATMQFRITGQTVDIQALTRFMKLLEASPFIQHVQLARSGVIDGLGKQVTEFQLDAQYEVPPPSAVRLIPVTLSVR